MASRILILGGTMEARELGAALAGDARYDATISLAGRTREPAPQPLPTRTGGFGGVDGLCAYLQREAIDRLIDATHPFAARMSANAAAASATTGVPLLRLHRPAWVADGYDEWHEVADMPAAVAALGRVPRRVLVTIGRQDVAPLRAAPWHRYLIRSVERPDPADVPDGAEVLTARGPFCFGGELALIRGRRIETLVTKNAGGTATSAKLEVARLMAIPVVMIARPHAEASEATSVADALAWLRGA